MIPQTILFASQNQGKQREIQAILADVGVALVLPSDVGLAEIEIEETGATFAENAALKAHGFAAASNLVCIADDSGLEVTALSGQPGVFSKRFGATDAERMAKVLDQLSGQTDRSAQFVSTLCYFDPSTHTEHVATGIVKGTIASEARGESGFGYDPVFIPQGYQQTFAELGAEVKNQLSHRAQAAAQLKKWLATLP